MQDRAREPLREYDIVEITNIRDQPELNGTLAVVCGTRLTESGRVPVKIQNEQRRLTLRTECVLRWTVKKAPPVAPLQRAVPEEILIDTNKGRLTHKPPCDRALLRDRTVKSVQDENRPLTRQDVIRGVHACVNGAYQQYSGPIAHLPKALRDYTRLGYILTGGLCETLQARFELIVCSNAPAFQHYGVSLLSIAVPSDAMGNRPMDGIGIEFGSYPNCVELAPKHTSGVLFNAKYESPITHPMLDGQSIVRFCLSRRPSFSGGLLFPDDQKRILEWVYHFLTYEPIFAEAETGEDTDEEAVVDTTPTRASEDSDSDDRPHNTRQDPIHAALARESFWRRLDETAATP